MLDIDGLDRQTILQKTATDIMDGTSSTIRDHCISVFTHNDFGPREGEETLTIVKVKKSAVTDVKHFLYNISTTLKFVYDIKNPTHKTKSETIKIVENMTAHLKHNFDIPRDILDSILLTNDWDFKNMVFETENELVYICWLTTA